MSTSAITVHYDTAMSNVSVAYEGEPHTDEELFPVVPVDKQSDFFVRFSKQQFQDEPDALTGGADADDIEVDLDARGYYYAEGHGYNIRIPDTLLANADPVVEIEIENTEKITEKIRLRKERNLASIINTTNITQNTTLSGTSQWSDYTNSDPILAIETQKETIQTSVGKLPNVMHMSRPVFRALRNHPRVIDRIKYTVTPPLSEKLLAEALEIDKVVVAQSIYKTSARGQLDALGYVWGKNATLAYVPPRPGKRQVALGYTFAWILRSAGGPPGVDMRNSGAGGVLVKKWRDEGKDSSMMGIRYWYIQQFIDVNCAFYWASAVA
jgi:hypothetical protein